MPTLDHNTLLASTGRQPHACLTCQAQPYKSYCRQCDDYFMICGCRPHGHEGHRVYPMVHQPLADNRPWDALDAPLRGIHAEDAAQGIGRACAVCKMFTPDPHFAYFHLVGCPLAGLAVVHRDLTGWVPPKGTEAPFGNQPLAIQPYEDPALARQQVEDAKGHAAAALRERDLAREQAAQANRFLEEARRDLRLEQDENRRLNARIQEAHSRPQVLNLAAGIRVEISVGLPAIGWERTIQCPYCSGHVKIDNHTPTFGHVGCPHCRHNLIQQIRAING